MTFLMSTWIFSWQEYYTAAYLAPFHHNSETEWSGLLTAERQRARQEGPQM